MVLKEMWMDIIFKQRVKHAIKKHHGRAFCYRCLNLMEWANYSEKEIAITPSQKIMLLCTACDRLMKGSNDPLLCDELRTAFRRWYYWQSGLATQPKETPDDLKFYSCLGNVFEFYGWVIPGQVHEEAKPQS